MTKEVGMARDEVSLDARGRRRAVNEGAFREINERMKGLNATFAGFTEKFSIVCECDDAACIVQLSVRPEEYEALRADSTLFAVAPGHDTPMVEDVVEERDGYHVVRKKPGEPSRLATSIDPRAR
jgi:hypothetical protein